MGFVESVKTCFQKYATFSGRASRSEFWWFVLFQFLVGIVAALIDAALGIPIGSLLTLAILLPYLAVTWRRFHDIDKPGYYAFIPYLAAIPAIIGAALNINALLIISGVAFIGLLILVIVWLASRGTPGPNRFGPPAGQENLGAVFS